MTIEQLEQISAIARWGSIAAAARELHISQPALSRSIRRMEAELGCALLTRTRNASELTEAGRIVADYGRRAAASWRRLRGRLDQLATQRIALHVGTCAPVPLWELTRCLVAEDPRVVVTSDVVDDEAAAERGLMNGGLDAAITRAPIDLPGFTSTHLMDENLFILLPRDHPLAGRDAVSFADVDGETFVVVANIGFWQCVHDEKLPRATFLPQEDRAMRNALLGSSSFLGIASDAPALAGEQTPGRVRMPISDSEAHVSFWLVTHDETMPDVAHELVARARRS